ncbi:hypothetical protein ACJJTC_017935 [Scirpophaga incertulas]
MATGRRLIERIEVVWRRAFNNNEQAAPKYPLFTPTRSLAPPPHRPTAFYFFAVAHFAVIAISTRGIIRASVCASVHVDRFDVGEQNPSDTLVPLAQNLRSLIKGGVTREYDLSLVGKPYGVRPICRGDFYKRGSPRGLVYLFRRRRRGRGGKPGGIRAISKGGRNTAIFIRAAGMQSRSGAGAGGWSGGGGGHFEGSSFYSFFARGASSTGARRALIAGVMRALDSTRSLY